MKKGQLNPANIKLLKQFLQDQNLHSKVEMDIDYLLTKFSLQHGLTMKKVRAYYREITQSKQ